MRFTEITKMGRFVVTSELGPPKGFHIEKALHEAGVVWPYVHAINVTDNQSSVMRLGGLAMCKALKEKGIEPVFQVTCRDRNRLALQSDILSAALFGIENLLLLTGDHTTLGDHKDAKPVFDLDSVSLAYMVKQLEEGKDLAGNALEGEPPRFCKGAGMAKFMNENVAGIHVPDNLIEELKKDKEKTKSGQTGIEISARLIKDLKPYCQGVHLMPLGWDDKVPKILELSGVKAEKDL